MQAKFLPQFLDQTNSCLSESFVEVLILLLGCAWGPSRAAGSGQAPPQVALNGMSVAASSRSTQGRFPARSISVCLSRQRR